MDNNNGKSYADLQTQLTTTYTLQGSTQVLSLVDVKLVDGSPVVGAADLAVSNTELDASHNGKVIWYQDAVSKTGPGTITFARITGTVAVDPAGKLQIQSGTIAVTGSVDPFTDSTTGQKLALSVGGGSSIAKLQLDGSVTLATGEVDLAKNGTVVFTAGTVDGVRTLIHDGKLTATAGASKDQAIGYLTGAQYNALHVGNTLGLSDTDLIAQYTWIGDTTLKGYIDATDFAQIDASWLKDVATGHTGTGFTWLQGDFDYDGQISANDFAILDAAFTHQIHGTLANDPFLAGNAAMLGISVSDYSGLVAGHLAGATVPEPASLGLLMVAGMALLRRRR